MILAWELVTGPAVEPLTIAEVRAQARITHTHEDGLLLSYLQAARQTAEEYLGRGLFTQTWRATFDEFDAELYLPMAAPLQSVTSITYYDVDGASQTLAASVYDVDTTSRPGKVTLKAGQSWPGVQSDRRAARITVTYVVGWTTVAAIPPRIKQGIRLYVSYLHADRDGLEQEGARALKAAESCWADQVHWRPPVCA